MDTKRLTAAGLAALALFGCAAVPSGTDRTLAARVAELEAREEIRAILVDYGRFLDAGDFEGYVGLFAADGAWVGGFGTFEGRDAIRGMLEDNMTPGPRERLTSLHLVSNEIIEVEGESARAVSKWFFIAPDADGRPRFAFAGRYEDDFVREGGSWRIARRVALGDIPFNDPRAEQAAAP
jgi:ketosteroid isomerase-like protein